MTATAIASVEVERIVRRFVPTITNLRPLIERGDLVGSFCDVESTGTDTEKDQIVELSIVPFTFVADGKITGVGEARTWLEDPGMPIPAEATKVHGITDEMVLRKRIVDGEVNEMVANSAIVIAHVSSFDRKMTEKRLPVFKALRWGCSYEDVPWRDEGYECAKLRCLMLEHASMDFVNHGSAMDCYAGTHLLSTTLPSGDRALAHVLAAARVSHVRVYATGSPFEYKDLLKQHGYFPEYRSGKFIAWFKDVIVGEDYQAEVAWLANHAMCHSPTSVTFDSRRRFSDRVGKG